MKAFRFWIPAVLLVVGLTIGCGRSQTAVEPTLPDVVIQDIYTSSYEKITGLSAVQTLTVPSGATKCMIVPEGQGIRWRYDGTDPDATTGMPVLASDFLIINNSEIPMGNIEMIETAASATVHVLYWR